MSLWPARPDRFNRLRDFVGTAPEAELPPESETRSRMGRYPLSRRIGQGGMGVVWEAEDPDLHRRIALKILREGGTSPEGIRRLHREAAIAAQLQHPHIVRIYEVGMALSDYGRPTHYIAMEYVEGRSLDQVLADRNTSRDDLLRLLGETARAVAFAHSKGVIHRDLKPANVLLENTGRVVLTDFGLARAEALPALYSKTNSVAGTPQYMAPEQVEGRASEIDSRTDVYALGVMLYEMLTNRSPYQADTTAETFRLILEGEPPPPRQFAPRIPSDLECICLKAMNRDRVHRYSSAQEFVDELERFGRGEPIRARPPSLAYKFKKALRRRGWVAGAAAISLIIGLAAVALLRIREFSRARAQGMAAEAAGDWEEASRAYDRALDIHHDMELEARARSCWERCRSDEEARKEILAQSEFDRRLRAETGPLETFLAETRPFFYVPGTDIRERLARIESGLEELRRRSEEPRAARNAELRALLGMGWYFVGDSIRAEEALSQADALGSVDPRVHRFLGRIFLERSMIALLGRDQKRESESRGWQKRAQEEFRRGSDSWSGATDLERDVAEITRALAEGREEEVVRRCAAGLARFGDVPGTEEYLNLQGWVEGKGNRERQVELYTLALKRRPHYAWGFIMRGAALHTLGRLDEAMKDYDAALALNPRSAHAHLNRAAILISRRKFDEAISVCDVAIRLDPKFADAYVDRGNARVARGEDAAGLADYTQAIDLNPSLAAAWNNRARLRLKTRDLSGAETDLARALALDPNYAEAVGHRGLLHEMRDELDEAIADFTRAIKLKPSLAFAFQGRGAAYARRKEWDDALADYDRALSLISDDPACLFHRGVVRQMKDDYPGAIEDFQRALEVAPPDWAERASVRRFMELARQHGKPAGQEK